MVANGANWFIPLERAISPVKRRKGGGGGFSVCGGTFTETLWFLTIRSGRLRYPSEQTPTLRFLVIYRTRITGITLGRGNRKRGRNNQAPLDTLMQMALVACAADVFTFGDAVD